MRMKKTPAGEAGAAELGHHKPGPEGIRKETAGTRYLSELFSEYASRDGLIQVKLESGEFGMTAFRNYLLPGMIQASEYTSRDVELLSFMVQDLPGASPGNISGFLTGVINRGKDPDYIIHTARLPWRLDNLLRHNAKNVIVRGDAGRLFCSGMRSGHVILEGGCGSHLGQYMEGGRVDVAGQIDHSFLAWGLKGGQIYGRGSLLSGRE